MKIRRLCVRGLLIAQGFFLFITFAQTADADTQKAIKEPTMKMDFEKVSLESILFLLVDFSKIYEDLEVAPGVDVEQSVFISINGPLELILKELGHEFDFGFGFDGNKIKIFPTEPKLNKTGFVTDKSLLKYNYTDEGNTNGQSSGEIDFGNGMVYQGEIINGMPHGHGKFYVAPGRQLKKEGLWSKGRMNGQGRIHSTVTSGDYVTGAYRGMIKDNVPDGCGLYIDLKSELVFDLKKNDYVRSERLVMEVFEGYFEKGKKYGLGYQTEERKLRSKLEYAEYANSIINGEANLSRYKELVLYQNGRNKFYVMILAFEQATEAERACLSDDIFLIQTREHVHVTRN